MLLCENLGPGPALWGVALPGPRDAGSTAPLGEVFKTNTSLGAVLYLPFAKSHVLYALGSISGGILDYGRRGPLTLLGFLL